MEKRYQVIKPKHGFYKGECLDTDIAPTIDTGVGCWHTLIGESMEEIKCEQVSILSGGKWDKLHDISRRVYSADGLTPTVHTMGGGQQELKIIEPIAYDEQNGYIRQDGCVGTLTTDDSSPKHNNRIIEPRIAAMRGRNPDNPSDRTADSPTEQRLEIGSEETSNTLTTVQKDNLVVEPTFIERALTDSNGETMSFDPNQSKTFGYRKPLPIARALRAENNSAGCVIENYRIRKLTERECFRLQGVKEEDFERVAKNQSTSSLYHLAGDSICCTCLMAIFGELFEIDYRNKINELVGELKQ